MEWNEESDIVIISELAFYAHILENNGVSNPARFAGLLREASIRLLEYSNMMGAS